MQSILQKTKIKDVIQSWLRQISKEASCVQYRRKTFLILQYNADLNDLVALKNIYSFLISMRCIHSKNYLYFSYGDPFIDETKDSASN